MRNLLQLSSLALFAAGCMSGSGSDDTAARSKMASDLVQCQNDRLALKEKIGELQAELQKLKAAAAEPVEAPKPTETPPPAHHAMAKKSDEGDIAPAALAGVVKRNSGGLRVCYEKGLKHHPDLAYVSSVKVRFSVTASGAAQNVSFSPHTDSEMEKCMGKTISHWQFPSFTGEPVQVEAPVNLVAK
jgi:hypothetical protein